MPVVFDDRREEVESDIREQLAIGLTEAAIHLQGNIVLRTPADTGRLKGSISYIAPKKKEIVNSGSIEGSSDDASAYVGTNVEYAPYVEYGTKYMRAQSYMRTGFNASKEGIRKIIKRRVGIDE